MSVRELAGMIRAIERDYQYTSAMTGLREPDRRVLAAVASVAREEFVPPEMRELAFANRALPIGQSQTISQPFIVTLMTDLLHPGAEDIILEIGTGSGYQAAILSHLAARVISYEIIPDLAAEARERLQRLGCSNVEVRVGDGALAAAEGGTFNGIIVTAAAPRVPETLIGALGPGGRLVIPVGPPGGGQDLFLVTKEADGTVARRHVLAVAFVPMTGTEGIPA